ncbi:hypothetical protein HerbRD11066_00300 [Herbidospora sp. RD11066]
MQVIHLAAPAPDSASFILVGALRCRTWTLESDAGAGARYGGWTAGLACGTWMPEPTQEPEFDTGAGPPDLLTGLAYGSWMPGQDARTGPEPELDTGAAAGPERGT